MPSTGNQPESSHLRGDLDCDTAARDLRWQLLFEQSPLSIQIFAPDGRTIGFNPAWENLFGLSREEAYRFNVLEDPNLIASGAIYHIRKAFAGEVVFVPPVPFPVRGHPQKIRWIGGTVFPVITPDGTFQEVVVIHHDITALKEAEETMHRLNEILEEKVTTRTAELSAAKEELHRALDTERQLNLLKSNFVSMVSHEFRTPLGIIMSAVELLRHYSERLDEAHRVELFDDIHLATRRMAALMEQMLVLGRAEAGKLNFAPLPLDLEALCARLTDESFSAMVRRCPIETTVEGDLSGAVADEPLLRHIFSNLLSNAAKYSPVGSPVELLVRRDGADAVFSVRDRGTGIPAADQPQMFEAFHRAGNVGEVSGTGLGLLITKRCVEQHGGIIEFVSGAGEGTTFTVRLPLFI